ncbi:hypothetical protein BJ138DRAFT_1108615 [Hygrophoropsis aurantiaca]|uniref:Uncharacterized protein n=1 Tax=Hygrophoropsis aurantiaca TaxID=72124 RepID=A0ACB8AUQ9_9AGAM|nr:hypothetical protein BJ138DRAFT_1108615 [Hygrophoropsis aurantiaca]
MPAALTTSSSSEREARSSSIYWEASAPEENGRLRVIRQHTSSVVVPLRKQASLSMLRHRRPASDNSPAFLSSSPSCLPLSPISTYSHTSWSGSSNTPDRLSPITPEFNMSPTASIACANDTPVTTFLTHFYDVDSKIAYDPRLTHLSAIEDLGPNYDTRELWNKRLPSLPGESIGEGDKSFKTIGPPVHDSECSPEEMQLCPALTRKIDSLSPFSEIRTTPRATRRFGRDFGVSIDGQLLPSGRLLQYIDPPESPRVIEETIESITALTASNELSALNKFPRPPSIARESVNLLTEEETSAVKEFLRVWGSHARGGPPTTSEQVSAPPALVTIRDVDARDSDEYSWEAAEDEEGEADLSMRCSTLLDQVSMMVGLPSNSEEEYTSTNPSALTRDPYNAREDNRLRSHSDVARRSSCGTNKGLLGYQTTNIAGDMNTSDERRAQKSLAVERDLVAVANTPQHHLSHGPTSRSDSPRQAKVERSPRCVRVPVVLAQENETLADEHFQGIPVSRDNSLDIVDTHNVSLRRWGQVFELQPKAFASNHSSESITPESSRPGRNVRPPPSPVTKPTSALDRLELSLSKLKSHAPLSQPQCRIFTEDDTANLPHKGSFFKRERRPSLPAVTGMRTLTKKHQSSMPLSNAGATGSSGRGSLRDRHFSSPVHQSVPYLPYPPLHVPDFPDTLRAPPRLELYDPFGRRGGFDKQCTFSDDHIPTMHSFMDMDMGVENKHSSRRASARTSIGSQKMKRLGKAASRLSQGVVAWGKNLTTKKVHD